MKFPTIMNAYFQSRTNNRGIKYLYMPRICPPQERAIYAASFPNAIKVIQKINIKYNTRKNPPLPTPKGKKKGGTNMSPSQGSRSSCTPSSPLYPTRETRNLQPQCHPTSCACLPLQEQEITKPQRS